MNKRNNKQSSTLKGKETEEYFDGIPLELVINILSRLPVKSKARCRCVLKLWSSIIRRPYYKELFPTKHHPAIPRLLFVFNAGGNLYFNSSTQHNNPDENLSLVATHHRTVSYLEFYRLCRPIHGLVCRQHVAAIYTAAVVSNPITGETLFLPKLRMDMPPFIRRQVRYFFGFDPILQQYKVLRVTWFHSGDSPCEYHVLTLGTRNGNLLWRNAHCCSAHYPHADDDGMCINGRLYYTASFAKGIITVDKRVIFCFDVRSESFSLVRNIDTFVFKMIDYDGKLGVCNFQNYRTLLELWVLEDAEKHSWSKRIYQVPMNTMSQVQLIGMIGSGELVFCSAFAYSPDPLSVFYYNLERNVITRVIVEFPYKNGRVFAFPNNVEDVKLM